MQKLVISPFDLVKHSEVVKQPCGCLHFQDQQGRLHNGQARAINPDSCKKGHSGMYYLYGEQLTFQEWSKIYSSAVEYFDRIIAHALANCYSMVTFDKTNFRDLAEFEIRWKKLGGKFDKQTAEFIDSVLDRQGYIIRRLFDLRLKND